MNGQSELQIDLADHHFEHDGTTVVHGNFALRIPETFLSTMWGIDDPNTLASDGLNASVGAAAARSPSPSSRATPECRSRSPA